MTGYVLPAFKARAGLNKRDQEAAGLITRLPEEKAYDEATEARLARPDPDLAEAIAAEQDPITKRVLIETASRPRDVPAAYTLLPDDGAAPRGGYTLLPDDQPAPPVRTLDERQAEREALEKKREDLFKAWHKASGGRLKPGQNQEQAIAEMFPEYAELPAKIAKVGVGSTGRNIGSAIGGMGGGVIGGLAAAPLSPPAAIATSIATSAIGSGVGGLLGSWIDTRLATDVTEEEAVKFMLRNAAEDFAYDAAGNLLILGGGKVLRLAGVTPRILALMKRNAALSKADPAMQEAVKEVESRTGTRVMAGQITDEPAMTERAGRALSPGAYHEQGREIGQAVDEMRQQMLVPSNPRAQQDLGRDVQRIAKEFQQSVKDETRPVFTAAKQARVMVNLDVVRDLARQELDRATNTPGQALKPGERAYLRQLVDDLSREDMLGVTSHRRLAGEANDMLSTFKSKMREMTDEGAPSTDFKAILEKLTKAGEARFQAALTDVDPNLAAALKDARAKYRGMMDTVFGDTAVTDALEKDPERIGEFLWQPGQVSRLDDFKTLLEKAVAQKSVTPLMQEVMYREAARSFAERNLNTLEKLATLSDRMSSDDKFRATYKTLEGLSPATGKLMKEDLKVLENAAKIAVRNTPSMAPSTIFRVTTPVIAGLSLATLTTGGAAMGVVGLLHAMSVARTQQNKGVINALHKLAILGQQNTPAARAAVREAMLILNPWLAENRIQLFEKIEDAVQSQPTQEQ